MRHPSRPLLFLLLVATALPVRAGEADLVVLAAGSSTGQAADAQVEPELLDLVGPVALYPDDLLAIVLPAATYPLQIVQAARYLEARKSQPDLEPDADWDESVVALLNYPEVLEQLNADLDWTAELGQAVTDRETAVLAAVGRFRQLARRAGNLNTDRHQVVDSNGPAIAIRPADPAVLYVPDYQPGTVLIHEPSFVYRYHARRFPVYYYPYAVGHTPSGRDFWGLSSMYRIAWQDRRLQVLLHQHRAHPYYGRAYAWQYGYNRLQRYPPGAYQSRWADPGRSVFHRSIHGQPDHVRTLRTRDRPRALAPRGERIELHNGGHTGVGQPATARRRAVPAIPQQSVPVTPGVGPPGGRPGHLSRPFSPGGRPPR